MLRESIDSIPRLSMHSNMSTTSKHVDILSWLIIKSNLYVMLMALGGLGIMLPMSLTTLIVVMVTTWLVVKALYNMSHE